MREKLNMSVLELRAALQSGLDHALVEVGTSAARNAASAVGGGVAPSTTRGTRRTRSLRYSGDSSRLTESL